MPTENTTTEIEKAKAQPPNVAMTRRGFEPKDMEQAWRFANALARSTMVPARYQNSPDDCIIALDLSMRLGVSYLAVMQHVYNVKGRPAMEAVLSTALTNASGVFCDPLEYEVVGKGARKDDYRIRAHAKRKSTGTVLYGPWIDWPLVRGERWDKKDGSKWLTMPEQMFHYRAASWFSRRHCPEVTMGMLTPEEAAEIPDRIPVESVTFDKAREMTDEHIEAKTGSEPVTTDMSGKAGTEEKPTDTKEAAPAKDTEAKGEAKYKCKACGYQFPEPSRWLKGQGKGKKKLEYDGCPDCKSENIEELTATSGSDAKEIPQFKYLCSACEGGFDEPKMSGPNKNVAICPLPDCGSLKVALNPDGGTPEFMED